LSIAISMNLKNAKTRKKEYYYITYLKWLFSNKNKKRTLKFWTHPTSLACEGETWLARQPALTEYVPTGHDWCTSATASLEHEFQVVGGCNPLQC
jgi:hypothetical protein